MRGVPTVMRAAVVRAFGGPEVVRVAGNVPVPRLAPDEVLIRVAAASVSPLDTRVRSGYAESLYAPMLPLILGRDVSGEIVARGANAKAFNVGHEVFGALSPVAGRGAHCEFVAVREAHLAQKPMAWTHAQAASVPFAALTAWRALIVDSGLKKDDKVVINGLGSTVGSIATQIAKLKGAALIAGSVGERTIDRLVNDVGVGMEHMWVYDARGGTTSSTVKTPSTMLSFAKANNWGDFDVALDLVGGEKSERRLIKLLKKGQGRLTTVHGELARLIGEQGVMVGGAKASVELSRKKTLYRLASDVSYSWSVMRQDAEAFSVIAKMARDGSLTPPPTKTFKLEHVAEAHQAMETDSFSGKLVLEP